MGLSPVAQAREALGLSKALSDQGPRPRPRTARGSPACSRSRAAAPTKMTSSRTSSATSAPATPAAENAGQVRRPDGRCDFTPVSMPLNDAQFWSSASSAPGRSRAASGVPPWMIGGSVARQPHLQHRRRAVARLRRPLPRALADLRRAGARGQRGAVPAGARTYPRSSLTRSCAATRRPAARSTRGAQRETGWMTRAEVRALEDLPAEPTPTEVPDEA